MSKHTAGPWELSGTTIYALEHEGWREGVEQMRNRWYTNVQGYRDTPKEEMEANARLMASSHELLEALEAVSQRLAWLEHGECRGFSGGLVSTNEALDSSRAAIAKAKGE